jgi:hypothetical protein
MSSIALPLLLSLASVHAAEEAPAEAASPAPEVVVAQQAAPKSSVDELTSVGMGIDAVPGVGIGTHTTPVGQDDRNLSLGLIGTYAGGVEGMEATTVVGIVRTRVDGIQMSGGINLVGEYVDGFQAAGGANVTGGTVDGFQAAGGINIAGQEVDGFQLAGGINVAGRDVDGMQMAGGVNVAGGKVDGPQLAGGINIANGVQGVQMAPVNISSDNVDGVQVGVINIARDSDVSLGLINIIYEGRTHLDVWQSSTGFTELALKHGGRKFHYIYGGGVRPQGQCPEWALTLGAGGHFELSNSLFIDGDLLARHVSPMSGFLVATNTLATARAVAGLQVFEHIAITGGLTANTLVSTVQDGRQYAKDGSMKSYESGVNTRGFPGVQFGVQLF